MEGLPAAAFKTDDFEPESKDRFYLDNPGSIAIQTNRS
jgi:hypothetical protein